MLITLLLAGNVAFHLEAHVNGTADVSIRIGIATVVLLISLIGGRIIPSFTRNWLAREKPGRLPAPFGRLDVAIVAITAADTVDLDCSAAEGALVASRSPSQDCCIWCGSAAGPAIEPLASAWC